METHLSITLQRFNLNIVECKVGIVCKKIKKEKSFNLNIVECKG